MDKKFLDGELNRALAQLNLYFKPRGAQRQVFLSYDAHMKSLQLKIMKKTHLQHSW